MTDFISRDGKPMELMEWAAAYEDEAKRRVALDKDVRPNVTVSTIWEGIVGLQPGIFESVILENGDIVESIRTNTEEEALAAHQELLRQVKGEELWEHRTLSSSTWRARGPRSRRPKRGS